MRDEARQAPWPILSQPFPNHLMKQVLSYLRNEETETCRGGINSKFPITSKWQRQSRKLGWGGEGQKKEGKYWFILVVDKCTFNTFGGTCNKEKPVI